MKIPIVGVAVPMLSMKPQSVVTLVSNLFATPNADLRLLVYESCYIQYSRTQLILSAQQQDCDFVFFMDHDVVFPSDTLTRLLACERPVVFGKYNQRHMPYDSTVTDCQGKRISEFPSSLFQVATGPTGCMLIDMEVFRRIQKPWFQIVLNDDGKLVETEDVWFCNQVNSSGLSIWCDPTIIVGHYGEAVF